MMKYILQRKTLPVVNSRDQFGVRCFFLYINDICEVCKLTSLISFADCTTVFCNGSYLEAKGNIDREFAKYLKWLKTSKVTPNAKKTHYMFYFFSKRRTRNTSLKLFVNG